MKRMISFLLSFAILFTFCGVRECLAAAGLGDVETPNLLGESVDVSEEITDVFEPVEAKKSFWEKTKKGLECIGGLVVFAGLVVGGGYILNLFKSGEVGGDKNLGEPENKYALDDVKEYSRELEQVNQIKDIGRVEITNMLCKNVKLENQNVKNDKEEVEEKAQNIEEKNLKEEEEKQVEKKVKRKELATYSGTCGDNLTWNLDTSTGVLTISGSGEMNNYSSSSSVPWYDNKNYITSVVIGDSVTSIGGYAFSSCDKLESVTIPDSVETIGDRAFDDCDKLTTIDVATDNANYASENGVLFNKNITTLIQYPAGKTETNYIIPGSVETIGGGAFSCCDSLTEVTIGNSVETIGGGAFSFCDSLTEVTIGNSVKTIGAYAFSCCDKLESVTIPDSVETIGDYAFYICAKLESVTIGNSVETIGGGAFSCCYKLESVTIGNSVGIIGYDAFDGCYNLSAINVDTDNANYASKNGVLFNKNLTTLITYPAGKADTSYTIPESVETIGNDAFRYCGRLTTVEIPDSVKTIGSNAFAHCSLTKVTIGDSVGIIGDDAFFGCSKLTTIDVDTDNTNYVSKNGVLCNKNLTTLILYPAGKSETSYTIPDSVETIGEDAFRGCSYLISVTIGNRVKTIEGWVFSSCDNLESVTIGNSVETIGNRAFYYCKKLATMRYLGVNSPTGNVGVFEDCTQLKTVKVPIEYSGTTFCGKNVNKCLITGNCGVNEDNLTWNLDTSTGDLTIYGAGAMKDYSYSSTKAPWYDNKNSIKSVLIVDGVETIGAYAFYECNNLTTVEIPNSITSIGAYAFYGCSSLTEVAIPDSVTSLGEYAFAHCERLELVRIPGSVT